MANIAAELQIFNALRERLAELYSLDQNDEAIIDTACGETRLTDVIAAMIRESRVAKAQAEGICTLMSEMQARSARLVAKHEKLRELAKWAMLEAGIPKLSEPDFSLTISKGRLKVITTREPEGDENIYVNIRTIFTWDKGLIKDALENGATLDFAFLSNAEDVLTVRGK